MSYDEIITKREGMRTRRHRAIQEDMKNSDDNAVQRRQWYLRDDDWWVEMVVRFPLQEKAKSMTRHQWKYLIAKSMKIPHDIDELPRILAPLLSPTLSRFPRTFHPCGMHYNGTLRALHMSQVYLIPCVQFVGLSKASVALLHALSLAANWVIMQGLIGCNAKLNTNYKQQLWHVDSP